MSSNRMDRQAGVDMARRRTVASFTSYREAERAVDYLSDRKFPVEHVAIVGEGLKFVEQVTGRMNWLQAALRGAATGAIVGLLVGWLFGLFDWFDPITSAFWLAIDGLWFGALVGALWGLILYAFTRGQRDFSSIGAMQAERYHVVVDEGYADQAERLIAEFQGAAAPAATGAGEPGRPEGAAPGAPGTAA